MGQTIESGQILSMVASFALVIILLVATLWVLRRIGISGMRSQAGRRLAIVDSLWLGNRQRIALVRIDGRELVVGISGQSITLITELSQTGASSTDEAVAEAGAGDAAQSAAAGKVVRAEDRGRFLDAMRGILSRDADKGKQ